MATINLFEGRSLTNAINKVKTVDSFVVDSFFKSEYHAADKIDIEIRYGTDRIAQFVNSEEKAKPVRKLHRRVKTVTPPRTFESKSFTAFELSRYNQAGDLYVSSVAERDKISNEMILTDLSELKSRGVRRREQMACEGLSSGKIVVSQDNIDFEVDFDFEVGKHLLTMSSKKWGTSEAEIIKNIRTWKKAIMARSGSVADTLILGESAAEAFLEDSAVQNLLNNRNVNVGSLELNKPAASADFLGKIAGVDIYCYSQQYTADEGGTTTVKNMIPTDRAILVASSAPGFRLHFAPIYRIEGGSLKSYQSELYVESFTNEDKTALEWKVEQKCLPAIHEPDAVISVKVI